MPPDDDILPALALTGIAGLDNVLNGGLTPDRLYLVEGTPGTGKTTLGLGFLLAGAQIGETGLYITLAETEVELRAVGLTHGWSLDPITIFEMAPADGFGEDQRADPCCTRARWNWARPSGRSLPRSRTFVRPGW